MLNEYEITDDRHRIDLRAVQEFMSDVSWGRWRTHEIIEQQVTEAWRVVTAHARSDASMVGFARAFSDGVSVAYLADVYVSPQHRGHGLPCARPIAPPTRYVRIESVWPDPDGECGRTRSRRRDG